MSAAVAAAGLPANDAKCSFATAPTYNKLAPKMTTTVLTFHHSCLTLCPYPYFFLLAQAALSSFSISVNFAVHTRSFGTNKPIEDLCSRIIMPTTNILSSTDSVRIFFSFSLISLYRCIPSGVSSAPFFELAAPAKDRLASVFGIAAWREVCSVRGARVGIGTGASGAGGRFFSLWNDCPPRRRRPRKRCRR